MVLQLSVSRSEETALFSFHVVCPVDAARFIVGPPDIHTLDTIGTEKGIWVSS